MRILNYSSTSGEITIHATDDAGRRAGPARLLIDRDQAVGFTARDLENGNVDKNLFDGVGDGEGSWFLRLETTLDIAARAYIRTSDGFLTSMHQAADSYATNALQYHVPFFNPASNLSIRSRLRVTNPNSRRVNVTIVGWDASGRRGDRDVRFSLAPRASTWISAQQLEAGDAAFTGRFGDGEGKWQLAVTGSQPLEVMSILATISGHLSNMSR